MRRFTAAAFPLDGFSEINKICKSCRSYSHDGDGVSAAAEGFIPAVDTIICRRIYEKYSALRCEAGGDYLQNRRLCGILRLLRTDATSLEGVPLHYVITYAG